GRRMRVCVGYGAPSYCPGGEVKLMLLIEKPVGLQAYLAGRTVDHTAQATMLLSSLAVSKVLPCQRRSFTEYPCPPWARSRRRRGLKVAASQILAVLSR